MPSRPPPGIAYTREFESNTNAYLLRKIITVRLSSEDKKMFVQLLEHKANQAARFGQSPPSQTLLMWAMIREAYFNLTQDRHRQQRLVRGSCDSRPLAGPFTYGNFGITSNNASIAPSRIVNTLTWPRIRGKQD